MMKDFDISKRKKNALVVYGGRQNVATRSETHSANPSCAYTYTYLQIVEFFK